MSLFDLIWRYEIVLVSKNKKDRVESVFDYAITKRSAQWAKHNNYDALVYFMTKYPDYEHKLKVRRRKG